MTDLYAASYAATELFPSVEVFDLHKQETCGTVQAQVCID